MTRIRRLLVVALAAWVVVLTAQNRPARIVSIVPALTEALFSMGAGPRVVGVGSFDRHPAEVETLPKVGGLIDPDMEQIIALTPDLVVLYGSQEDQVAQLERAGISVFVYAHGGLTDTLATIRELGGRTGQDVPADALADRIADQIAQVRSRIAERPRPRVMLVFGREPGTLSNVYASGGLGFLHDMVEAAGGDNVFSDVARESVQLSSESMLTAAPDIIIELSYDERMTPDRQAAEREVWNRLRAIPAVQAGRVHLLLGNEFVQPGPRMGDATEAIARAVHPEAF